MSALDDAVRARPWGPAVDDREPLTSMDACPSTIHSPYCSY
jgi:hypothetical protein